MQRLVIICFIIYGTLGKDIVIPRAPPEPWKAALMARYIIHNSVDSEPLEELKKSLSSNTSSSQASEVKLSAEDVIQETTSCCVPLLEFQNEPAIVEKHPKPKKNESYTILNLSGDTMVTECSLEPSGVNLTTKDVIEDTTSCCIPLLEFHDEPAIVEEHLQLQNNESYTILNLSDGTMLTEYSLEASEVKLSTEDVIKETTSHCIPLSEFHGEPAIVEEHPEPQKNESYSILNLSDGTMVSECSWQIQSDDSDEVSSKESADDMVGNYESNSGSEYEPTEDTHSSTSSSGNEANIENDEFEDNLKLPDKNSHNNANISESERNILNKENENSLNVSNSCNEQGKSSKDDSNMFVSSSNNSNKTKKLFCMYCGKFQSKFARHLENVHKDQTEVKKFINLKKGTAERKKIIDTIKKNCQFHFNTNDAINDGELIVSRRPAAHLQKRAVDYGACQNCKGFFTKNNLRHHAQRCFSYTGKKHRTLLVMGRKIIGRIHPDASNTLRRDIFPILREDDVIRSIRYDRLIILFGNKMCCKYRLQHHHDMIRANLRVLGRYLIALKEINQEIREFSDIYDPKYYDDAVSAIHVVGGFEESTNTYKSPSTAYNVGSLLKKIGKILVNDCIKQKLIEKKLNAEDFLKLLIEDIEVSVNKTVMETRTRNFRRKKNDLPSKEDIQLLTKYLTNKRSQALIDIKAKFSKEAWMTLAKTTLTSVHLFNRRRAGEIERIFIEDFETYSRIDEELLKTLQPSSKKLAENYVRFTIRGKLNRTVPVLLSREMMECIETLLKFRGKMGVYSENRYVFGIPGPRNQRHKYLRACELMRTFALECGAPFPSTLRGTKLRKHIATNCINLNLSESEVVDVANFMGHSEKIHKEHYRQPIVSREILRMSRVLELAQGGDDTDSEFEEVDEEITNHHFSSDHEQPSTSRSSKSAEENTSGGNTSKTKKRSTSPFGPVKKKRRWSEEEVSVATMIFGDAIKNEKYPSLRQIQEIQLLHPCLKNRNPSVIKAWISNKIKLKHKGKF